MASKRAIGVMTQDALDRIEAATARIAVKTGTTPPEVQQHYRDPEYRRAMQLQVFAEYLERLEAVLPEHTVTAEAPKVAPSTAATRTRSRG